MTTLGNAAVCALLAVLLTACSGVTLNSGEAMTLVRERYGASGPLFDIARVESTTASAERTTGEYEGRAH